ISPENSFPVPIFLIRLKPTGFILACEKQSTINILAYSTNESLHKKDLLYQHVQNLILLSLNSIDTNTISQSENPAHLSNYNFRQWPANSKTGGWIETTWHQNSPYNDRCPMDPITKVRSLTGCMGTALAQIYYYHRSVENFNLTEGNQYQTRTRGIKIDADSTILKFPAFQQLNQFLFQIQSKFVGNTSLTESEIATLNFTCGVILKTDFTSSISTTSAVTVEAVKKNTGYNIQSVRGTDPKLFNKIKENIINAQPAILLLPDHAIIADGYNTEGFFHLNFGWGENSPVPIASAWFKLNNNVNENPSVIITEALYDIIPHKEWENTLIARDSVLNLSAPAPHQASVLQYLHLKNPSKSPLNIDYILAPPYFLVGSAGGILGDSTGALIIPPESDVKVGIQFIAPDFVQHRGDLIIAYNNEKNFLIIDLIGNVAPVFGTKITDGWLSGKWTKSNSPYHIFCDLIVGIGERFEIEDGCEIIFWGPYTLIVKGNAWLIVSGTSQDSVIFKSINPENGWGGIRIWNSGSDDTLSYCIIQNGQSESWGGALWITESAPVIRNSCFVHNQAQYGGAIYLWKAAPFIQHVLICHNQADFGGGISAEWFSKPKLINVTLSDNQANTGGGIHLSLRSKIEVHNSIIWNNDALQGATLAFNQKDTVNFYYCDVDTLQQNWCFQATSLQNFLNWDRSNLSANPLFTNYDAIDYTLNSSSPCVDAGDPSPVFFDTADPADLKNALWPGLGTIRNDQGVYGGNKSQFRTHLQSTSNKSNAEPVILLQNFPNPFNEDTQIHFYLPETQSVEISIYDCQGRLVNRPTDQIFQAGHHQFHFDARLLSSGVYFYQIKTQKFLLARKMILLR
ncbi:C10 family peptidase, partial [candidate division KSB1 bacterium]|nr:C10 family peptidase [candidate division KSB1 bacterium]